MPAAKTRVVLLTGDGKGKSSSALGMVLRAVGQGLRVALIHFIKADLATGETLALARFPEVELHFCGRGFIRQPSPARLALHREAAARGLDLARVSLQDSRIGMVVLDEICGAITLGLLDTQAVIDVVRSASVGKIVILTGRGAPRELIDLADTVSRVDAVKHAMDSGWPAQPGVEY
jgi:cob(I)alamin adenosyltransferase